MHQLESKAKPKALDVRAILLQMGVMENKPFTKPDTDPSEKA